MTARKNLARMDQNKETFEGLRAALEALDAMPATHLLKAPTHAGQWYWKEWDAEFKVYTKKGKGRRLYVTPPGGVEIPVSARIAGGWFALPKGRASNRVLHS